MAVFWDVILNKLRYGRDTSDKGVFANYAALVARWSTGKSGWHAFVESTNTDWRWDVDTSAWVNTGAMATPSWGNITGTLNNQTDLKNALLGKEAANVNIQGHIVTTGTPHVTSGEKSTWDGKTTLAAVKADADVASAIASKHTQGTDTGLDFGGANPITAATMKSHVDSTGNPHGTSKSDVGLGNVANAAQVTAVTGSSPVTSTGGTTPVIGLPAATAASAGHATAAQITKLDGIEAGANNYTLPTAAAGTKGGVKIGARLTMTDETLSADVQTATPEYGEIRRFPGGSAPALWLACSGLAVSQATYAALYAKVGLLHDFASWTAVGINNSNGVTRIGYGNLRFMSVENGACKYSTDYGANWTRVVNLGSWRGIAYSPTLDMWICVGDGGIMDYSTDGGATWSAVATPSFGASDIHGICWDSTNLVFIAVGGSGKLATSSDGATFTQQTSNAGAGILYSVCHCPSLGISVAVGATGVVVTSPDDTTWTLRTIGVVSVNLYDVAAANNIGVVVCSGQSGRAAWTRNGINWVPFYITHENQIQVRVGTDGTRFLVGNYTSNEMTLINSDMVPRRVAQYSKFSWGGIAWGGGAWVIGGTDAAVHAAVAAYSYNSATHFRLPSPSLDAGIYSDSYIYAGV